MKTVAQDFCSCGCWAIRYLLCKWTWLYSSAWICRSDPRAQSRPKSPVKVGLWQIWLLCCLWTSACCWDGLKGSYLICAEVSSHPGFLPAEWSICATKKKKKKRKPTQAGLVKIICLKIIELTLIFSCHLFMYISKVAFYPCSTLCWSWGKKEFLFAVQDRDCKPTLFYM